MSAREELAVTLSGEEVGWLSAWIARGALTSEMADWLAAREQALREEIAREFESLGPVWGGDSTWLTTGNKVAALAAETVRGDA